MFCSVHRLHTILKLIMPGILQKKYELTNSKLDTLEFSLDINNISIVFKILFLNNSVYIYISDQNNQTLTDLSLVLPNADGMSPVVYFISNVATLDYKSSSLINEVLDLLEYK